jgi:hypothetical protein
MAVNKKIKFSTLSKPLKQILIVLRKTQYISKCIAYQNVLQIDIKNLIYIQIYSKLNIYENLFRGTGPKK